MRVATAEDAATVAAATVAGAILFGIGLLPDRLVQHIARECLIRGCLRRLVGILGGRLAHHRLSGVLRRQFPHRRWVLPRLRSPGHGRGADRNPWARGGHRGVGGAGRQLWCGSRRRLVIARRELRGGHERRLTRHGRRGGLHRGHWLAGDRRHRFAGRLVGRREGRLASGGLAGRSRSRLAGDRRGGLAGGGDGRSRGLGPDRSRDHRRGICNHAGARRRLDDAPGPHRGLGAYPLLQFRGALGGAPGPLAQAPDLARLHEDEQREHRDPQQSREGRQSANVQELVGERERRQQCDHASPECRRGTGASGAVRTRGPYPAGSVSCGSTNSL